MNPGDMLIQAVLNDLVVPDIRFNVPAEVAIVVPGNLVCDSRDLHRMISEGRIRKLPLPLDTNPRLNNRVLHQPKHPPDPPIQVEDPEVLELRSQLQKCQVELRVSNTENQRLNAALSDSRTECGQLLAECGKLRAEISKLQEGDSKLNAILGKLDSLPTQVVVQSSGLKEVTSSNEKAEERDIPFFMPTMPEVKSSHVVGKTNVVENTGETAGEALRKFRKGRSS